MKFDKNQNCIVTFKETLEDSEKQNNVGFYNSDNSTVMCACCGGIFEIAEIAIVKAYPFNYSFAKDLLINLERE